MSDRLTELRAEYKAAQERRDNYGKMIDDLESQFEKGEIEESEFVPEHNSMVDTINEMDAEVSHIFNEILIERRRPRGLKS